MKRLIALAVVIFALQAVATFGGEPVGSSTQVTPPPSFFRQNEFDTGAFGTFVTGLGSGTNAGKHAWGEAWIPLIGSPGNMQVSGSKRPVQLAVEVGGSALSSLAADCKSKGA
jgi:hypothetical protein